METVNSCVRIAPPDRAAALLRAEGYPVNGKLLRRWYKAGIIPGCDTGKRVLLPLARIKEVLENGIPDGQSDGGIRRVCEQEGSWPIIRR